MAQPSGVRQQESSANDIEILTSVKTAANFEKMTYVLFDFVGRNEIGIGRQSWIVSYYEKDEFTNSRWDKKDIVKVGWPSKGLVSKHSGSAVYDAKVLWISGSYFNFNFTDRPRHRNA